MQRAALYSNCNEITRRIAKRTLSEYAKSIQWRNDGNDAVMDIGCGPGDITVDIVRSVLPMSFKELIGTDISEKMVNYANDIYGGNERVKFEILDIATKVLPEQLRERFDHLTSFFCLHWVQNQRKSVQNMFNLLKCNGGDCLLLFIVTNYIFDVYEALAKQPKWAVYMNDFQQFISPYHKSQDAGAEYRQLLQETGFTDLNVEVRHEVFEYRGVKWLRDFFISLCPFYDRIPSELREEFLDDYMKIVRQLNLYDGDEDGDDFIFRNPYKLMIVYARKPSTKKTRN